MGKPEKPEYYPKILQAILLLLLFYFVFTMVPGLFLVSLFQALGFKENGLLIEMLSAIMGFTLLMFWINRRYRIDYQGLFSLKQLRAGYIMPMIIMITGANILLSELDNLLRALIPMNDNWARLFEDIIKKDPLGLWKLIIVAVVVAPLVEEMIFRGVILKGFLKHYPPHRAIAVSALLFGIAHPNPWQFWMGVSWGVISGWWFYETRSLVPSILGHAFANSLALIIVDWLRLNIPGYTGNYSTIVFQPWWFDLMGAGLLGLGTWILIRMFIKRSK
jgi:membrane protease YdiL (CAAX protease family)